MEPKLVEVCRSFSFKLNTGNYQSVDFFCSQKSECLESEVEKVSEALYKFVKSEVIKSVNAYKLEIAPKKIKVEAKIISNKEFEDIRQGDEKERQRNQKEFEEEIKSNPNWKRANKRDKSIPLIEG